ncbi:nucleoside-diphosphate sugar epimerase/dehydratase [Listeria cornellensis]|uniref:Polysaccharide biosynthesis protein CapD n=1 Tax=Listeria cornellensis FSL F6-0969 TaxID=1265820 RepID=W7BQ77_9LIST|nr:polysaccharide biosynthesis protein [Listeria cornellensis]EUJ25286.1 polysaccharide biosynthesis protein CapD [Listeria cornellensis FSL F6-0969]
MSINKHKLLKKVLIIGAGVAGIVAAKKLSEQPEKFAIVAFLDDDPIKQQLRIIDIPIVGDIENLETCIKDENIDLVVLAIPSLGATKKIAIMEKCKETATNIRVVTGVNDITFGNLTEANVSMEKLLGRTPVQLNEEQVAEKIEGTIVMVTGAGGSIGSEICRQICAHRPKQLIVLGHGENSIYGIHMELLKNVW